MRTATTSATMPIIRRGTRSPATATAFWRGRRRTCSSRDRRLSPSTARACAWRRSEMPMTSSASEVMTIAAARALRNSDICFVGIGMPSAACNLARRTHAPDITLIYESGTIATKPDVLPLSIGDGELCDTALTTVPVPEMFRYWLQGGRFFFFSSRRRHTRCLSDWSSDVCSSDLAHGVQHLHVLGVGIVVRKGVVELAVERDDLAADRLQHLRREGAGGAVAAGADDLQAALELRPIGEVGDVAGRKILHEGIGAAAAHVEAGVEHDFLQPAHLVGAEGERAARPHLHAGPAVVVVR